jgi:hypothetical protein
VRRTPFVAQFFIISQREKMVELRKVMASKIPYDTGLRSMMPTRDLVNTEYAIQASKHWPGRVSIGDGWEGREEMMTSSTNQHIPDHIDQLSIRKGHGSKAHGDLRNA